MTKKELEKILYAMCCAYGKEEAVVLFEKLIENLGNIKEN